MQVLPAEIRSAAREDGEPPRQCRHETVAAKLEPSEGTGDRCTPEHDGVLRLVGGCIQLPEYGFDLLLVHAIQVGIFAKRGILRKPSHQSVIRVRTITSYGREMNQALHARLIQGELEHLARSTDIPPLLCGDRLAVELANLECQVHDRIDLRRAYLRLPAVFGQIGLDPLDFGVRFGRLRLGFEIDADEALDPGNLDERVYQG